MHLCYKLLKLASRSQVSTFVRCAHQKSIAQATIDKGHSAWEPHQRPLYMDAQVKRLIYLLLVVNNLLQKRLI